MGRAIEKGEYSPVPVKIDGFSDISAVAAGYDVIAALKKDGTVWMLETNPLLREYGSYEYNDEYYYGEYYEDEYYEDEYYDEEYYAEEYYAEEYSGSKYELQMESKTPYQVNNLSRIKSISSFGNNMDGAFAAVREDGTVWTWRDGSEDSYYTPAQVKGISDAVMVAPASRHMLALKKDGTVWTWGEEMDIEIGDGNMASGKLKYVPPAQIPGLTNVTFIAAAPDALIMQSAIAVKAMALSGECIHMAETNTQKRNL